MRILTLSNCPLEPHLGSGKTRIRWSEGLRALGHEVDVLDDRELRIGNRGPLWRHRLAAGAWLRLRRRALEGGYDLLEFFGAEFGWAIRSLSRHERRPLIVHHTDGLELLLARREGEEARLKTPAPTEGRPKRPSLRGRLDRDLFLAAFADADAFVTGCSADLAEANRLGLYPHGRAAVVEPGVDPVYFGPLPESKELSVVFLATWSSRKAPERVAQVMSRVLNEEPHARFDVLGASGQREAVLASFSPQLHPRIQVADRLPEQEVAARLRRARVFFLPSIYEGFGMATAEAMCCGCAAVVTPTGFGANLRHGVDACVHDFPDVDGMANSILRLLRDRDHCAAIARAGWERASSLRWEDQVAKLASHYTSWLTRPAGGTPAPARA